MDTSTQNPSQISPTMQSLIKKLLRDMQTSRMAFEEHSESGLLELHQNIEREKNAWDQTKKDVLADTDRDISSFEAAGKKLFETS